MNSDLIDMVESSFGSVWALELLLVLHRQPDRIWSAEELVNELRSSEVVVAQSIDNLVACGLIVTESGGRVRYSPASPSQSGLVDELEDEYRKKPAAIRRMIIQNPAERLKSFADAFKLTKG
jgi:predicted transcriptional regulator